MNKSFEEAYKEEILSDLPDLWSRIEAALPEIDTINKEDTNKEVKQEVKEEVKENKKVKKFRVSPVVWALIPMAAIAFIVVIPLAIGGGFVLFNSGTSKDTSETNAMFMADAITVDEVKPNSSSNVEYDYSNGSVAQSYTVEEGGSYVGQIMKEEDQADRFNHEYDYTTDFDKVTGEVAAIRIELRIDGFYTNEQGLNAETTVIKPGRYATDEFDTLVNFQQDECICVHLYKDRDDLELGRTYVGNIYLATDGTKAEWWEFVVKE